MQSRAIYSFYVLLFLSFLILVFLIVDAGLPLIRPDSELGFAGQMPSAFWIGFILLLVLFGFLLSSWSSSMHYILWMLLLIGYWNSYIFIHPTPVRPDSYRHFADVFRLLEKGSVGSIEYGGGGWPGLFILAYAIISVTGFPPLLFLRFYPLLVTSTLLVSVFVIVRRFLESDLYGVLSAILVLFGSITLQHNFTPHSIAYALLPFLFMIFYAKNSDNAIIFILIYAVIVITYGLASIWFVAVLLTNVVMASLSKHAKIFSLKNTVLIAAIFLLLYTTYNAQVALISGVRTLQSVLFGVPSRVPEKLTPNLVYPLLAWIRGSIIFAYLIVGMFANIYLIVNMHKHKCYNYLFLISAFIWAILFSLVSPFMWGTRAHTRTWYLMTLSSSLSVLVAIHGIKKTVKNISTYKYFSLILIGFLGTTGFIAFHAYDSFLVAPVSELRGTYFIAEHWEGSVMYDGRHPALPVTFYRPSLVYQAKSLPDPESISLLHNSEILVTRYSLYCAYFLSGRVDDYNALLIVLDNTQSMNRVYDLLTLQVFTPPE